MTGPLLRVAGIVIAGVFTLLVAGPSGQAPAPPGQSAAPKKAAAWKAPRTPWGDPDIQGTWNNGTITPLERARGAGEKELLTREEEEEINEQSDTRATVENRPRDAAQDVELAYDQVWWDRGRSIGRTSLITDPKDGRLPPLTPQGERLMAERAAARGARGAFDSWTDRPLQERCILYHGVPPLPTGYNNNYEITQAPGVVAIFHEEIHEVRIIPLDGRPHSGSSIRQWMGDSRGRWDGDTLIVETTNFRPDTTFRFPADPATLRVIERFRRVAPDAIDYQFTVENPTFYSSPWTATLPMRPGDGLIYEYACHEGNYAIVHVLQGHRAEEKRAEEAAKQEGARR